MSTQPTRQQLLARDLMMHREHAAENRLFNKLPPAAIVRQQLEQYRINQAELEAERNRRREDAYQPPAPLWVQMIWIIPFIALMTFVFLKGADFALAWAGGAL